MLAEFLQDYLSIIIFLALALLLSTGFILVNFIFSPKNILFKIVGSLIGSIINSLSLSFSLYEKPQSKSSHISP